MRSHRIALFLAAFAAAAAGPAVPRAFADEKDELAQGDWTGKQAWQHQEVSGDASGSTVPPPGPAPGGGSAPPPAAPPAAAPAGSPTPPPGGTGPRGTPTIPAMPKGDLPPGEPGDIGPADPGPETPSDPTPPTEPPTDPPTTPPVSPPVPLLPAAPAAASCHAHWACETVRPNPELYQKETLLTLVLFRTDSYAFVCNGYARSESTWYIDWFATTEAQHDGQSCFVVTLHLVDPCPLCKPKITLLGCSELQAKVQVKTQWGGVDESTSASASSTSQWAGDIDCSDSCSANIHNVQGGGQAGLGLGDLKLVTKGTKSYLLVDSPGGKSAGRVLKAERTDLMIVDRGDVATYAGGTEDNAQAKSRVGYRLRMRGESCCGPWGEYVVELIEN